MLGQAVACWRCDSSASIAIEACTPADASIATRAAIAGPPQLHIQTSPQTKSGWGPSGGSPASRFWPCARHVTESNSSGRSALRTTRWLRSLLLSCTLQHLPLLESTALPHLPPSCACTRLHSLPVGSGNHAQGLAKHLQVCPSVVLLTWHASARVCKHARQCKSAGVQCACRG